MPNNVIFHNNAGFDSSFSIQWDGGETGRTQVISLSGNASMDLTTLRIPTGASCWARAYVQGGPNHDSGDNFTYDPTDTSTAVYTISGGTLNPSFSLQLNTGRLSLKKSGQSWTTVTERPAPASAPGKQSPPTTTPAPTSAPTRNLANSDQTGRFVIFYDNAAFSGNFSVQWDGGETYRTDVLNPGDDTTIDLKDYLQLPAGTSCWARVYIIGGVNHDSGRNFNYDPNSNATIQYTVTGGCLTPSFN